ncbi:hypothetical protein BN14_02259 [Rhizoctonia solani AG-1 IB]|uniref:Uncharacterized protein n=1 Tax=Thanatephorus cucumeris (strain AG1-IB / isolate 7/3/14) TaxID=1108050 RepID=M5BMR9_THACB|nr:hypothetical protein BN14_02259 [Rhizoctonia solani AG-1 IB]
MDEWDSSVWANSAPPSGNNESSNATENTPTTSHLVASQSQTLSFSLDDAFDDKSAPTTPSFFSTTKLPSNSTFGAVTNGSSAPADDGFGDFDDFAATSASVQAGDDDFGEFGDFGDGEDGGGFGANASHRFEEVVDDNFQNDGFGTASLEMPTHWQPLSVDPLPPPNELSGLVQELMGPCWASLRPEELMSDEPERQVEGLARILVTPERITRTYAASSPGSPPGYYANAYYQYLSVIVAPSTTKRGSPAGLGDLQ